MHILFTFNLISVNFSSRNQLLDSSQQCLVLVGLNPRYIIWFSVLLGAFLGTFLGAFLGSFGLFNFCFLLVFYHFYGIVSLLLILSSFSLFLSSSFLLPFLSPQVQNQWERPPRHPPRHPHRQLVRYF
jgi:hypothetical protein